jgi:hypothetical protein
MKITVANIREANNLLSQGEISTEEMIINIIKARENNPLIDYVEGVVVWEKVEFEFTCEQFLEYIGYTE